MTPAGPQPTEAYELVNLPSFRPETTVTPPRENPKCSRISRFSPPPSLSRERVFFDQHELTETTDNASLESSP